MNADRQIELKRTADGYALYIDGKEVASGNIQEIISDMRRRGI